MFHEERKVFSGKNLEDRRVDSADQKFENDSHSEAPTDWQSKVLSHCRVYAEILCESDYWIVMMTLLTLWTLYQGDIQLAATPKDADYGFLVLNSICFFLFALEILLQSLYREGYLHIPEWDVDEDEGFLDRWERRVRIGSFYFWMDVIATFTLATDMTWMLDNATNHAFHGDGTQSAQSRDVARISRKVGKLLRVARIVRFTRIGRLYRYAVSSYWICFGKFNRDQSKGNQKKIESDSSKKNTTAPNNNNPPPPSTAAAPRDSLNSVQSNNEELPKTTIMTVGESESKVGGTMADLTNRRVILVTILMLIGIQLLRISDDDMSLSLGVQLVHRLASLNATDPLNYEPGLLLAINVTLTKLPVLAIIFNDRPPYYSEADRINSLRESEMIRYYLDDRQGTSTTIIFDQKNESVLTAQYSMYMTTFVICLLIGGIYAFSVDVQTLVIQPIEKLVVLVKKIADNPLGVEYKMLGTDDGFIEGMETTILLTTITKIGGLMRVGFGEAGAGIIARNLKESSGGKLNLLGPGQSIYSIFGFCDVRQFTDTTECLQEEVMLFVNRIAHILHSIVVQCAGSANKNIGDAFLLSWKVNERSTKETKSRIADQALLTFIKALIELSRHQEFICNFSVAATSRLLKRFPDYKVRIGCGLHVGWAVEGAIGSNRKIDATYISPHVSTCEFLESSTKEYGVSLLMSEPFYRLLSPYAQRFVRQVDRIKRATTATEEEEGELPMGLYTYDVDLSIDWNDRYRSHRKQQSDAKSKFIHAVRRTSQFLASGLGATTLQNGPVQNLPAINEDCNRSISSASHSHSHSQVASILSSNNNSHNNHHHLRRNSNASVTSSNPPSAHAQNKSLFPGTAMRDHHRSNIRGSLAIIGRPNHPPPPSLPSVLTMDHHHHHPKRSASIAPNKHGVRGSVSHNTRRRTSISLKPQDLSFLEEVDEEHADKIEEDLEERLQKAKETPTIMLAPYTENIWTDDQDLVDARHLITDAFRSLWSEGMDAFIIGDWTRAHDRFSETFRLSKRKDGPSKRILEFIERHGKAAPEDWKGFVDLSEER